MTRDECYESPKELYACDGLEYRTCSSSVSHYRAHDKRGKLDTYQYAKRSCSQMSTQHVTVIPYKTYG